MSFHTHLSTASAGVKGSLSRQRSRLPAGNHGNRSRCGAHESPGNRAIFDDVLIVHIEISHQAPGDQGFACETADFPRGNRNCHREEPYAKPGRGAVHRARPRGRQACVIPIEAGGTRIGLDISPTLAVRADEVIE